VAIDANVRRVLTRWFCADVTDARELKPAGLESLAQEHLDRQRPGDWNQALMDLGAGPCRAEVAHCGACPVAAWCAAGRSGNAVSVPPPVKRPQTVAVSLSMLAVRAEGEVLLFAPEHAMVTALQRAGRPIRRTLGAMLGGTLVLPMSYWYSGHGLADDRFMGPWENWLDGQGWAHVRPQYEGRYRHTITHHRLEVHVLGVDLDGLPARAVDDGSWHPLEGLWPATTLVRHALNVSQA